MVLTGMMYHPVGAPDLSLAALKCHFFGAKANLQLQVWNLSSKKAIVAGSWSCEIEKHKKASSDLHPRHRGILSPVSRSVKPP
jgi:hypothetical protein